MQLLKHLDYLLRCTPCGVSAREHPTSRCEPGYIALGMTLDIVAHYAIIYGNAPCSRPSLIAVASDHHPVQRTLAPIVLHRSIDQVLLLGQQAGNKSHLAL